MQTLLWASGIDRYRLEKLSGDGFSLLGLYAQLLSSIDSGPVEFRDRL
jgi:hypothetical protein